MDQNARETSTERKPVKEIVLGAVLAGALLASGLGMAVAVSASAGDGPPLGDPAGAMAARLSGMGSMQDATTMQAMHDAPAMQLMDRMGMDVAQCDQLREQMVSMMPDTMGGSMSAESMPCSGSMEACRSTLGGTDR